MNGNDHVSLHSSSVRNGRRERTCHGETGRDHRQSVGADISAFAREWQPRQAMARSPSSHERHSLEVENRRSLARGSRALRFVANLLRPLRALAARWNLGGVAFAGTDSLGRGGRGGVGSEGGRKRFPSAPARGGSQAQEEPGRRKKGFLNPPDEALGRSKGGFSTKLHLSCDGKGRPLSLVLTGGQRHESTQLETVLDAIRIPRVGRGRPRKKPSHLIADKGYSYPACRDLLSKRHIPHTIPQRRDQRERREKRPGRKPSFEKETYRRGNVVERCVNKLKQWRAIATRYDKRAVNYRAGVIVASLMIWLAS